MAIVKLLVDEEKEWNGCRFSFRPQSPSSSPGCPSSSGALPPTLWPNNAPLFLSYP